MLAMIVLFQNAHTQILGKQKAVSWIRKRLVDQDSRTGLKPGTLAHLQINQDGAGLAAGRGRAVGLGLHGRGFDPGQVGQGQAHLLGPRLGAFLVGRVEAHQRGAVLGTDHVEGVVGVLPHALGQFGQAGHGFRVELVLVVEGSAEAHAQGGGGERALDRVGGSRRRRRDLGGGGRGNGRGRLGRGKRCGGRSRRRCRRRGDRGAGGDDHDHRGGRGRGGRGKGGRRGRRQRDGRGPEGGPGGRRGNRRGSQFHQ